MILAKIKNGHSKLIIAAAVLYLMPCLMFTVVFVFSILHEIA
jgi:hypothetical protein